MQAQTHIHKPTYVEIYVHKVLYNEIHHKYNPQAKEINGNCNYYYDDGTSHS